MSRPDSIHIHPAAQGFPHALNGSIGIGVVAAVTECELMVAVWVRIDAEFRAQGPGLWAAESDVAREFAL